MTTYETGSPDHTGSGGEGLKEKATDAAAEVGAGAKNVAGVAKDEASHVASEAKSAARGLLYDARTQLTDQASTQKQRAADSLRNVGSQFSSMASSTESGAASSLVRTLSKRADSAASWLSDREPADIVQDVRGFARRNTGLFLAIAAGVGVVAGRVVRALREGEPQESTQFSGNGYGTTPALGTTGTPGYRTDDYLYLPLGMTARSNVASAAALSLNLEFDVLLHGWQKTRDSELGGGFVPATSIAPAGTVNGFTDIAFSQSKGWALRASANYPVTRHLSIEPYYVRWDVGSSPTNYETATFTINNITAQEQLGAYEPHNTTNEFGVKLGFHF